MYQSYIIAMYIKVITNIFFRIVYGKSVYKSVLLPSNWSLFEMVTRFDLFSVVWNTH